MEQHQFRGVQQERPAAFWTSRRKHPFSVAGRRVRAKVADTEAATDVQLLQLEPLLIPQLGEEVDHDGDGVRVRLRIQKLRADVAVDAPEAPEAYELS